jgi:hypothetical protein
VLGNCGFADCFQFLDIESIDFQGSESVGHSLEVVLYSEKPTAVRECDVVDAIPEQETAVVGRYVDLILGEVFAVEIDDWSHVIRFLFFHANSPASGQRREHYNISRVVPAVEYNA